MTDLYGAIDLGGTKLRAVVADLEGNIRGEVIQPSEAGEGPERVIARMIETLEAAAVEASVSVSDIRAVGVASPSSQSCSEASASHAACIRLKRWTAGSLFAPSAR